MVKCVPTRDPDLDTVVVGCQWCAKAASVGGQARGAIRFTRVMGGTWGELGGALGVGISGFRSVMMTREQERIAAEEEAMFANLVHAG